MIASVLFFLAALFYLIAGLGLLRLPDSLARLHAGTKASSLATALALAAAFAHHGTLWSALMCGASLLFVFLTAPLASHAIARCIFASRLTADPSRNPTASTLDPPPARPLPASHETRIPTSTNSGPA